MEPSRFWLRRDDDDQARQVVYDKLQLDRYTERQKRAILKAMARGKSTSHRDIRQAARRATGRPRHEQLIAVALALAVLAVLFILIGGRNQRPNQALATEGVAMQHVGEQPGEAGSGALMTAMDRADRAWLDDVGTGKVVGAKDGSDVLTLPRTPPPQAGAEDAADRRSRNIETVRDSRD